VESDFSNVYEDETRADAYAQLEFPATYYLAYRDLPAIIGSLKEGGQALDFGCGTGRSTRFLRNLGFEVVGVDISEQMLAQARALDQEGDYRLIEDGGLGDVAASSCDIVLSIFTFDNIPTFAKKVALFEALRGVLKPDGKIVSLVSSPEIYVNEWASFSTRNFPENRSARNGDRVRIVMLDVPDGRPVEDVLWTDEGYRKVYAQAGLRMLQSRRPLATPDEPYPWVSETSIAPWVIYVLAADP